MRTSGWDIKEEGERKRGEEMRRGRKRRGEYKIKKRGDINGILDIYKRGSDNKQ